MNYAILYSVCQWETVSLTTTKRIMETAQPPVDKPAVNGSSAAQAKRSSSTVSTILHQTRTRKGATPAKEPNTKLSMRITSCSTDMPSLPTPSPGAAVTDERKTQPTSISVNKPKTESARQKMMRAPNVRLEHMLKPDNYLKIGNAVYGPATRSRPQWPAIIIGINDDMRKVGKATRKLHKSGKGDAYIYEEGVTVVPIQHKLFDFIYLNPDFVTSRTDSSVQKDFTCFRKFYSAKDRVVTENIHICKQEHYFDRISRVGKKNDLGTLYGLAIQMADMYDSKKLMVPGISSQVYGPTSSAQILCAVESICWIAYIILAESLVVEMKVKTPSETVIAGFQLLQITTADIYNNFKRKVHRLRNGTKLPCVDNVTALATFVNSETDKTVRKRVRSSSNSSSSSNSASDEEQNRDEYVFVYLVSMQTQYVYRHNNHECITFSQSFRHRE